MKANPLISVIMSVYNEEKYIKESLQSLLTQTLGDFEIIIIDDCSTDNTVNIIKSLNDDRINLINNEVNQGLTKNLNKALRLCRGKFIARMDGDDISRSDRFEVQTKYLDAHPDIMLISCNTATFGEINLISDIKGSPENLKCKMLIRPQLAHPGFMMRRELIFDCGFTYDEYFRSAQDYDFAARVSRIYQLAVTKEGLIQYRAHEGQVSQTPSLKQFGYADEIRARLFDELGMKLTEKEIDAYHYWVLEKKANKEIYSINMDILKRILKANTSKKIYDGSVLRKTMYNQFFTWLLRANDVKYIPGICKANLLLYGSMFGTGCYMMLSKQRRKIK